MSFGVISLIIYKMVSFVFDIFYPTSLMNTDVTGVISRDKISVVQVECLSFSGKEKSLLLEVLDVTKDDVLQIFRKLKEMRFPIYTSSCYSPRNTRNDKKISLHAYAAAIDVNYLMNPYYDEIKNVILPVRENNQNEDREAIISDLKEANIPDNEILSILDTVMGNPPRYSNDKFLDRSIIRKGMITREIVDIFKTHGFNIWGGDWKQPTDYMHFQIPRSLVKELVDDKKNFESRKKIWEDHKKNINKNLLRRSSPKRSFHKS